MNSHVVIFINQVGGISRREGLHGKARSLDCHTERGHWDNPVPMYRVRVRFLRMRIVFHFWASPAIQEVVKTVHTFHFGCVH